MPRTKLFIYGSCVSRDTVSVVEDERFELRGYVARQSLISAGRHASAVDAGKQVNLSSEFQKRMVRGDIAGDAIVRISEVMSHSGSWMIWDLTDERCGVLQSQDGNSVLTRSQEVLSANLVNDKDDSWLSVPFGTAQHRSEFIESHDRFLSELKAFNILDRSLVLAVPWASKTVQGTDTPPSYGFSATQANEIFTEYHDYLEYSGWQVLRPRVEVLGDEDNIWGNAPFHFCRNVYEDLAEQISDHITELECNQSD